ncbi:TauD/TfdA family dioxygenase [Paraburkholderia caledonica]|uniref:Alpha-ketoglutarate-dependent taurine dioxygenase n=1 Tax=Paraburkholderia caledonica TaxID=134536 RepID=A0AB73II56_9BURK|nr:alpha-ketoglutarate-dependent taurine dioxygenase [Paraburkholderia caledonica]
MNSIGAQLDTLAPHVKVEADGDWPVRWVATDRSFSLEALLAQSSALLRLQLCERGAVLLRGFAVASAREFGDAMKAFGAKPLAYQERSTPRTHIEGALYTATEYPAREPIFLHNENAYASHWPRFVAFFCERPAEVGGAMTLADTRDVYRGVPADVRHACETRGLSYLRRFIAGVGYSWQEAFGVREEAELARVLAALGYLTQWDGDQCVVQRASTWTMLHPETDEPLWFNHGVFFNAMSLPEATRRAFEQLFGAQGYPFQTTYRDGSPIDEPTYRAIKKAYVQASRRLLLQRSDVLLLDNLLTAHGREAYEGQRRHYVMMLD